MARKLPKIINQEEFEKLFKTEKDKKFKLAMLLAFEGGLRISEIVGLEGRVPALTKSNVESSSIRIVSGKGKKDRIVPRPKRLNETAKNMLPLKIPRRTLQYRITELGKKILEKHITFHTLRHGFGSHLAGKGRPLHEIQMLMGHSRLDTTGIYLHANPIKAIEGANEVF
jgi:integrase/recombinase XerD